MRPIENKFDDKCEKLANSIIKKCISYILLFTHYYVYICKASAYDFKTIIHLNNGSMFFCSESVLSCPRIKTNTITPYCLCLYPYAMLM